MSSIRSKVGGVIAAVPTPFDKEGHVAEPELRKMIDFMIAHGLNCLFMGGSDGEGLRMSTQERKKLAEIAIAHTNHRIPVIIHVGTPSIDTAIELAKHAEATGADVITAVQPFYYSFDQEGILNFYKRLTSATNLPFLIYNNPARTHNPITLETMKNLAKLPNVIGCKDTSGDIRYMLSVCRDIQDFVIVVGEEALVYSASFFNNYAGSVSAISSSCPEAYVDAFKAFKGGDRERIRNAQFKLITLEDLYEEVGYLPALKEALRIRRICEPGPMIPPFHELTPADKETLRNGLEKLGYT